MKIHPLILATAALSPLLPLAAQTVYTIPQGYTRVNVPGASADGSPTLTVISANLMNEAEYAGSAALAADFNADPDSNPATPNTAQTVTCSGAAWTTDQYTAQPHLAYLVNSAGAEQAFLITSHTADTLTIDGSFDLMTASRFSASTTVKIRKANTVGSILGTTETPFTTSDRAFLWSGSNWLSLVASGGQWFFIGAPGGSATDHVVYPEEGIFVLRQDAADAQLTFFGEVPSLAQASTVVGESSHFVSTRFPVGASPTDEPTGINLQDLNIDDIPNWSTSDRVYFWSGSSWSTFIASGGNWFFIGGSNSGGNANEFVIPNNSALFISRASTGDAPNSPHTIDLPYEVITSTPE